jgi:hypothetical protein
VVVGGGDGVSFGEDFEMRNAKEKTLIPLVTPFSLKKLVFIKKLSLM